MSERYMFRFQSVSICALYAAWYVGIMSFNFPLLDDTMPDVLWPFLLVAFSAIHIADCQERCRYNLPLLYENILIFYMPTTTARMLCFSCLG